jgi:hypothetical protein
MFVKHLQEYLDKFTEGPQGRRGNAVSNARIYIATPNGYLEEIRRIEQRPSVRAPLNLLKEIFTCTLVQGSWSLKLAA